MAPRASVVIATYNCGEFIAATLDSVVKQTIDDWEVVIVDDGSTDQTREVVEPYLKDSRIRYLPLEHCGQPAAKNAGVRATTAPLIAFLDADDVWMPTKLERQIATFHDDPELGVAYTRRICIDEQGYQIGYAHPPMHRGLVLESIYHDSRFICFSSSMVSRAVFDAVGGFDERFPWRVDYDLWLRIAKTCRFDYDEEPLVAYRVRNWNDFQLAEERYRTLVRVRERFINELGGKDLLPWTMVRRSFAATYAAVAFSMRDRSRSSAVGWYLRALASWPGYLPAWKGLAGAMVPERGRRLLRRALGRSADWKSRPRIGATSLTPTLDKVRQSS